MKAISRQQLIRNFRKHHVFFGPLLFVFSIFDLATAQAIESTPNHRHFSGESQMQHKYVHIVRFLNNSVKAGWIIKMDSTQVELLDRDNPGHSQKISQHEIASIKIHKKGAGGRGVLIGVIAGGLAGGIIGEAAHSSPPTPYYSNAPTVSAAIQNLATGLQYGAANAQSELNGIGDGILIGMLGGGIIGGIIGSETYVKKFEINGDPIAFEKARIAFSEFENHNSPL